MNTKNVEFKYPLWSSYVQIIIGLLVSILFLIVFYYFLQKYNGPMWFLLLPILALLSKCIELYITIIFAPLSIKFVNEELNTFWLLGNVRKYGIDEIEEIQINRNKRILSQFTIKLITKDHKEILVGEKINNLNLLINTILRNNPYCRSNINLEELELIEHKYW